MTKLNKLINDGVFDNNSILKLSKNSFANFFDVINKGENSYFNICKNLYFDNTKCVTNDLVEYYKVTECDTWSSISYKFYRTYQLWWVICKFNNIANPFKLLSPGTILIIPTKEVINSIISIIMNN